VQQVALAGWSLSHGLSSLHADGILAATMPGDLGATADTLIRMLVDGVRPRGATGKSAARPRRKG